LNREPTTLYPPAIDALVNSSFLSPNAGENLAYLFKDIAERPAVNEPKDLLALMAASGVGAGVVSIMEPAHAEWVSNAHREFPRKILPAMIVDPRRGFAEIERVVEYHERYDVRCLRIPPFRYQLPPTDRIYWPFYVKAIELDIPVSMNAGMPGPRYPGWVQNPVHYDEVAYHFPQLRIVMTHCGQPWVDEAISVISHWDNVFMAATSVAPKYWSPEFIRFINSRGREKMLFGTEYPTISWERSRSELHDLGLRPESSTAFFEDNARRVYKWDADATVHA
jgi:uncharacterized protein